MVGKFLMSVPLFDVGIEEGLQPAGRLSVMYLCIRLAASKMQPCSVLGLTHIEG